MQTLPILDSNPALSSTPAVDSPAFSLETPAQVVAAAPIATPALPPAPPAREMHESLPPILVADDDPDDTFFIQRLIKKTGVKNPVKVFDDGTEVVNYLGALAASHCERRRGTPLLLFLDLRMSGLGGFGFLEWVRAQKNKVPLTIVVLSNSAESADVERALELGAHRYLVKYPCVQTISTIVRSVYPQTVF